MKDEVVAEAIVVEHKRHPVKVKLNGGAVEILSGFYGVEELKVALGVPRDYELELVVDGRFIPLHGHEKMDVQGHEHFISHVRHGSSS